MVGRISSPKVLRCVDFPLHTDRFDLYGRRDPLGPTRAARPTAGTGADFEQLAYESVAGGARTSGLAISFRNRAGDTIGFGYDALGRLTSKDLPGSEPDAAYGYDLMGRMTSAAQGGTTLAFAWDALGRQLSQTVGSRTYSSTYDLAGRRTRITHPDGFFVDQDYLVTGEMTKIRENGATSGIGVLATYEYDQLGRRDRLVYGNGDVTDYGYDPVSRLQTLVHDLGGTANDNIVTFAYNAASQIVGRTATNDLYAWTGHGNGSTGSIFDGRNRLTQQGGTTLGYDANGNMTSDGTRSYGYDSENRLVAFPATAIRYDPLGRLDGVGSPVAVATDYDGVHQIAERSIATGAVQLRHVFGPGADEPLVTYVGTGTATRRFLTADERGSIVAATDSSAALLAINRYDEYGKPQVVGTGFTSRFLYTGQRYYSSPGIYYYKARFYDPRLPRFLQPDAIGYGAGPNLYGYVGGDPVNNVDPSGLTPTQGMCTGTRVCSHHDSGAVSGSVQVFADVNGFGAGRGTTTGTSATAGSEADPGSDDSPSAPGWWRRTWSEYGIPGDWVYMGSAASFVQAGWLTGDHDYEAGPNVICPARWKCTAQLVGSVYSQVRFAVPGNTSAARVVSGQVYTVRQFGLVAGNVRSYVGAGGLTISNVTLGNHILYDGWISRNAYRGSDGTWYSYSHGAGTNYYGGAIAAGANQLFGPSIFNGLDRAILLEIYSRTR